MNPAPNLKQKMKEVLKEELPKFTEIVFSVFAPEAKEVYVSGDFNNWKLDENSRMISHNGTWSRKLYLNSGRYHYRFIIDGKWVEALNTPSRETNPYGELNSLLEIKSW